MCIACHLRSLVVGRLLFLEEIAVGIKVFQQQLDVFDISEEYAVDDWAEAYFFLIPTYICWIRTRIREVDVRYAVKA